MATPWQTLPLQKPGDGEVVWARLNYWFGQPFLATWRDLTQAFEPIAYPGLFYPFWTVSRWRSQ